jgi:hypothetical protein
VQIVDFRHVFFDLPEQNGIVCGNYFASLQQLKNEGKVQNSEKGL